LFSFIYTISVSISLNHLNHLFYNLTWGSIILEHNHVPKTTHILSIAIDPLNITHRNALQCGADIMNGEIMKP
jgi:hypothetical protein